jgi:hypothetical protein
MPAGPSLACFLDMVAIGDEPGVGLGQAALLETMRAARKTQGWAVSRELQAIAEFTGRVEAEDRRFGWNRSEFVVAELSAALGLTDTATFDRMVLADRLVHTLTDTFHALRLGLISFEHAKIIATATKDLDDDLTAAVEDAVLPDTPRLTTGQLRAALKKALVTVDPEAFKNKRDAEVKSRRVEAWDNQFGTTDLCGRGLPDDLAQAALNRLTALAKGLQDDGDTRTMDQLRADLYLALLLDRPTHPGQHTEPGPGPGGGDHGSGSGSGNGNDSNGPGSDGSGSDGGSGTETSADYAVASRPDDAGHPAADPCDPGPVDPDDDGDPGPDDTIWSFLEPVDTGLPPYEPITTRLPGQAPVPADPSHPDPADQAVLTTGRTARRREAEADQAAQARETGARAADQAALELPALITEQLAGVSKPTTERLRLAISEAGRIFTARHRNDPGATATCMFSITDDGTLRHGADAYRPPAAMRRLIDDRDGTCRFVTCRRPAARTDCDHTLAHAGGGPTCPCNLSLLCRFHHRMKQQDGWTLRHLFPGVLLWITPTGGWHLTGPAP